MKSDQKMKFKWKIWEWRYNKSYGISIDNFQYSDSDDLVVIQGSVVIYILVILFLF